ncbi:RNA demethylase ALKBH9B-like isoform X2 [Tripterygium wilfordii]|uniref:RNA demethylase ALKBH9B-like isoform X2 n=1 Tax=Tripterygium wilfordii TaxID=458696 RepID=UPI0018F845BD|nr:RNA demethylase ALKBH9B-like isoform X2 [Tripterygium wilfordii]
MAVTGNLDWVRNDDPFLMRWLPFLSRDLCHMCNQFLSDRIRSLNPKVDGEAETLRSDEESEETGRERGKKKLQVPTDV